MKTTITVESTSDETTIHDAAKRASEIFRLGTRLKSWTALDGLAGLHGGLCQWAQDLGLTMAFIDPASTKVSYLEFCFDGIRLRYNPGDNPSPEQIVGDYFRRGWILEDVVPALRGESHE